MALTKYDFDTVHSSVAFTVRHLVISKVRGTFKVWGGDLQLDLDDLTKSKVEVRIDAASIDTHEAQRDGHLRSADFFDAEAHPHLVFKSTKIEKKGGDNYALTGDLTIRGVTKTVTLDTEFTGSAKDPWGGQRVGFSASTKINRGDYGLKWNQALETGGVLVGEAVEIHLEIQAKKA